MIPYVPQPVWRLGPIAIHGFGLMAAIAVVLGFWLVRRKARQRCWDPDRAGVLYALTAACGIAAGVGWARISGGPGVSATGTAVGGLLTLVPLLLLDRSRFWTAADVFTFAFPPVTAVARAGCFLAHDHVGRLTQSWIGVRFPGGTRYDLGLLYSLSAGAITLIIIWMDRRGWPAGALTAASPGLMSAVRLAILQFGSARAADDVAAAGGIAAALMIAAVCGAASRRQPARTSLHPEKPATATVRHAAGARAESRTDWLPESLPGDRPQST